MRAAACLALLAFATTSLADDKPVKWEHGVLTLPVGLKSPPALVRYTWMTAREDVVGDGWKDLAQKMKLDLKDTDVPIVKLRLLFLDHLGGQGWELVTQQGEGATLSYTFKRRVP